MTETLEMGPESPVDERVQPTQGDGPEGGSETPQRQNREARYRVERNQARAERDALARRVEQLLTREAERLAAKSLANPADLMTLGGVTINDLLDDDGEVDPEKVDAVVAEILASRPGLAKNAPAFDPTQGLQGGGNKPQPSWGALIG
jgi:hypothetical protein